MAMNGDVLGAAIATAMGLSDAASIAAWKTVAGVIVTHIQTNGVITVASVSGVATGPGVSGPGAGTIQ